MMPVGTPAKSPALPCTLTSSLLGGQQFYSFQGSQIKLVKVSRPRCDVLVVRRCVLRPKKELKALQYLKKWLRCPTLAIRRSPGVRWARDLTCLPKRWEPGTTWRAPFSLDQLLWGTHSCLSISMFSFKSPKWHRLMPSEPLHRINSLSDTNPHPISCAGRA